MTAKQIKRKTKNYRPRAVVSDRLCKPKARSRISNGQALLPSIDQRTIWYRRFRDLNAMYLTDLGGSAHASTAEASLVRRIACIEVELERVEMLIAQRGEASNHLMTSYLRGTNTLRRLLKTIGISSREAGPESARILGQQTVRP